MKMNFCCHSKLHIWRKSPLQHSANTQVILNENKQKTKVAESYRNPVFEEFSSTFLFPVRDNIKQAAETTSVPKMRCKIPAESDGKRGVL